MALVVNMWWDMNHPGKKLKTHNKTFFFSIFLFYFFLVYMYFHSILTYLTRRFVLFNCLNTCWDLRSYLSSFFLSLIFVKPKKKKKVLFDLIFIMISFSNHIIYILRSMKCFALLSTMKIYFNMVMHFALISARNSKTLWSKFMESMTKQC